MGKQAEYISKIEIKALWQGGRHIEWELRPDVNILSGINGVGKSTIINHSVKGLHNIDSGEILPGEVMQGINIRLYPADAEYIKYDVIRSFDRPLLPWRNWPTRGCAPSSTGRFTSCSAGFSTIR